MLDILKIGIEDVCKVFGIKEDLYKKYFQNEIEKNKELISVINSRNTITDWRKETPLGGPGTILNGVVLYCLIRHYGLGAVLETGVSGGIYSSFILSAVKKNKTKSSKVISIELSDNLDEVGKLVPSSLKKNWNLVTGTNSIEFLSNNKIQKELYCHDSLHTLTHMLAEFLFFKRCKLDRFFIFIDDQDSELFWEKMLKQKFFTKPGYSQLCISGNESRLNGHLGGFIKYEKNAK